MKFKNSVAKDKFVEKVQSNRGKLPSVEEMVKMINRGITQTEIGLRYGVSRQSVCNALKKAGVKFT